MKKQIAPSHAEVMSINAMSARYGSIAAKLLNAPITNAKGEPISALQTLRTNALLRKDEWIEYDSRVIDIARMKLVAFEDLRAAGLVKRLRSIGVLISQYETSSDMTDADVDMSGVAALNKDSVEYLLNNVPVPVIAKGFEINARRLAASRMMGDSVSTVQATVASRKVADKIESIIFNGIIGTLEGAPLYGYKNHPNTNTGTAVGDFSVIANVYATMNNMVLALEADNHQGPFQVYMSTQQFGEMRNVYTDGSGQSVMTRLKANIPQIRDIKVSQALNDGEIVMVEMTEDTVDFVVAEEITLVEWDEKGGMLGQFKVMFIGAPRVKADQVGHSGVAFYTGG